MEEPNGCRLRPEGPVHATAEEHQLLVLAEVRAHELPLLQGHQLLVLAEGRVQELPQHQLLVLGEVGPRPRLVAALSSEALVAAAYRPRPLLVAPPPS